LNILKQTAIDMLANYFRFVNERENFCFGITNIMISYNKELQILTHEYLHDCDVNVINYLFWLRRHSSEAIHPFPEECTLSEG